MSDEPAGISRTAQATAFGRSQFDRPHTPDGDPEAQRKICEGMEPLGSPGGSSQEQAAPNGAMELMGARTRFFDQQVLDAIAAGVTQIVICGAGYDDRALRFRHEGVQFFELDQTETQADKASRLEAFDADTSGLTFAPADFRVDDVTEVLANCGHDAAKPSLFICEGLLAFFEARSMVRFLGGLADRAASGSTLAATLEVHADGLDSAEFVATANATKGVGRGTESVNTIVTRAAHRALVEEAGWRVEHVEDATELDHPDIKSRTQFVVAVAP